MTPGLVCLPTEDCLLDGLSHRGPDRTYEWAFIASWTCDEASGCMRGRTLRAGWSCWRRIGWQGLTLVQKSGQQISTNLCAARALLVKVAVIRARRETGEEREERRREDRRVGGQERGQPHVTLILRGAKVPMRLHSHSHCADSESTISKRSTTTIIHVLLRVRLPQRQQPCPKALPSCDLSQRRLPQLPPGPSSPFASSSCTKHS